MSFMFLLGVDDPEMRRIENFLEGEQIPYVRATKDGKRCHPGNAYQADIPAVIPADVSSIIFIECKVPGLSGYDISSIDHHFCGDVGYGLPPSQYWQASSLGQLCGFLMSQGYTLETSHEDLVLAAMDHSPAAAIRGECPGISAQEIFDRKVVEIAAATKSNEDYVRGQIEHMAQVLGAAPNLVIGGQPIKDTRQLYLGEGYSLSLLAMQVAALAGGRTALLRHRDTADKPEKWSISGHATPGLIKAFKEEWAPSQGLVGVYGVPERGYAGGYLPKA